MTTKKAVSMNDSTAANDAPDWGDLLARVAETDDKAAFRAIYQHFAILLLLIFAL